jgi:1,4-alpha-glucan branching enzyme
MRRAHAMPFGAMPLPAGGVRFALWAPAAQAVSVRLGGAVARDWPMQRRDDGWFDAVLDRARPCDRYLYVIDGGRAVPDPASRFQPEDVHGWSEVIDPLAFDWQDDGWRGRPWHEAVLYELHVGTFTAEGRYAGVAAGSITSSISA